MKKWPSGRRRQTVNLLVNSSRWFESNLFQTIAVLKNKTLKVKQVNSLRLKRLLLSGFDTSEISKYSKKVETRLVYNIRAGSAASSYVVDKLKLKQGNPNLRSSSFGKYNFNLANKNSSTITLILPLITSGGKVISRRNVFSSRFRQKLQTKLHSRSFQTKLRLLLLNNPSTVKHLYLKIRSLLVGNEKSLLLLKNLLPNTHVTSKFTKGLKKKNY